MQKLILLLIPANHKINFRLYGFKRTQAKSIFGYFSLKKYRENTTVNHLKTKTIHICAKSENFIMFLKSTMFINI